MNESEANKLAHSFLCDHINLERCRELPSSLYESNPSNELIFSFSLFGKDSIGGVNYISVTKKNKQVRYLGFHGE